MRLASRVMLVVGLSLSLANAGRADPAPLFDIRAYGTKADSPDKVTDAVNQAIKACAQSGGGAVFVPAGTYVTGPIELLSHVTLHLDAGAVLKGSEDLADYDRGRGRMPLLRATRAENIAIVGRGTIDGSGTVFMDMTKTRT